MRSSSSGTTARLPAGWKLRCSCSSMDQPSARAAFPPPPARPPACAGPLPNPPAPPPLLRRAPSSRTRRGCARALHVSVVKPVVMLHFTPCLVPRRGG
jgi:hypothetical protein